MNDLISVIMGTYNETEKDLREAIDSVLGQTYEDFELIVVCDNPNNKEHREILTKYAEKDSRVKVLFNDVNLGLAMTLNKGIAEAKGKYIARMDADDISLTERFKLQVEYMETHPECDVVGTNRIDIDENSNLLGSETSYNIPDEKIESIMRYGSVVVHPSIMMKKSVIESLGGYRNFRAAQDYDLWLRVLSSGYKIHIMQDKLLRYRIRSDSISKVNFARQYFYTKYAIYLYDQRKNGGMDEYSEENTLKYLDKCGMNDTEYVKKINSLYSNISNSVKTRNKKGMLSVGLKTVFCPEMIKIITRGMMFKKVLAKLQK